MPKKQSSTPSNKYGISNLNFGRPGFSLEAPSVSLQKEEKKTETSKSKPSTKSKTSKTTASKPSTKVSAPKMNTKKSQNAPKTAIRKAAGRGK